MASVLLIEDERRIREVLARALTERGHGVRGASTAMAGLQQVLDAAPDVVVLDLGLPDLDGRDLLNMLRAMSAVPVIIATARDDEGEITRALDAGADDYIVKPFSAGHLDARIRAVLRRSGRPVSSGVLRVGELRIDPDGREVTLGGQPVELNPREFDLLHHLAVHAGQVVTKQELLTEIWGRTDTTADKTIDVHLSWLRRKLGESAAAPRYLHTIRNHGMKLVDPTR